MRAEPVSIRIDGMTSIVDRRVMGQVRKCATLLLTFQRASVIPRCHFTAGVCGIVGNNLFAAEKVILHCLLAASACWLYSHMHINDVLYKTAVLWTLLIGGGSRRNGRSERATDPFLISSAMHYNTKIKTKLKYRTNNSYSARNACR